MIIITVVLSLSSSQAQPEGYFTKPFAVKKMGIGQRGTDLVEIDFATMNIGFVMIEGYPIVNPTHFDAGAFHTQFHSSLQFELSFRGIYFRVYPRWPYLNGQ
jgi:hypothetical protein